MEEMNKKTTPVYYFKELGKDYALSVYNRFVDQEVEDQLNFLGMDLDEEMISEEQYWETIGCSKFYGSTTSWFIPSVYFEKHGKEIKLSVKESLKSALFLKDGRIVY